MVTYNSSHMRLQPLLAALLFPDGIGSRFNPAPYLDAPEAVVISCRKEGTSLRGGHTNPSCW